MIDRKKERDELASYDKNGRDKRTQAVLSVDGLTINSGGQGPKYCVNAGNLYYLVPDETSQCLYKVPLSKETWTILLKAMI